MPFDLSNFSSEEHLERETEAGNDIYNKELFFALHKYMSPWNILKIHNK
jgi:hypothetical protein